MGELEVVDNIENFIVVDELNDFICLIEDFKNQGEKIEEKYITALKTENVNFSTVEGTNVIFENCVFNKVVFQKTYFKNCFFKNCDFSNCDFSNSTFSNCKFQNVKGVGTNFSDSAFKDVKINECLLRYAVFTYSLFNICNIEQSDMSEAFLDDCKVKKFTLNHVNLVRANFYKTVLKGIDLRTCQIDGLILSSEAKEIHGAVVDMLQAAELAKMLGVIIK